MFEYNFIAINRMISIYQTTKCKNFDVCKMCSLIRRVLSQVKDHGKAYYLIATCFKNKYLEKKIINGLEKLDKKELLYYFAMLPPFPHAENIQKSVLESSKSNPLLFFPSGIINNDGKKVAIGKPIFDGKKINEASLKDEMERVTKIQIDLLAQGTIGNMRNILVSKYQIEEQDIMEIIEQSAFVRKDRRTSYLKGLMAGFKGDILIALCILIPQVEQSIRDFAEMCGEVVYNIKEDSTEELKSFNAILDLPGMKKSLDEDLMLVLKTVFCSKFGFNMRNEIAHGTVSDVYFKSFGALYAWWLVFRLCYMFCGILRHDMQEQFKK